MRVLDLMGQEFGALRAERRVQTRAFGRVYWRCTCRCGAPVLARADHLRRGETTHCGCSRVVRRAE